MSYTQDDINLLAKCGWLEARGDGIGACYCVMHVVNNRVKAVGFPKTVSGVILQPNAFSWTRPDDPEYNLKPADTDVIYQACLIDAANVLSNDSDPTSGALWYANEKTVTAGWYFNNIINRPDLHPVTVQIGHHTFRK